MVSKMWTMYETDRPSTLINDTRWLLHFGSWSRVRSAMPNNNNTVYGRIYSRMTSKLLLTSVEVSLILNTLQQNNPKSNPSTLTWDEWSHIKKPLKSRDLTFFRACETSSSFKSIKILYDPTNVRDFAYGVLSKTWRKSRGSPRDRCR